MGIFRSIVLGVFLTIFFGSIFLAIRNGVFKSVDISLEERPALTLLYKEHVGPYHKILDTLKTVEDAAKTAGIDCTETFGEYLDDPNAVEHERLRSHVGCSLSAAPATLPEGTLLKTIPSRRYVVGVFRGSPSLGPLKVYGKAGSFMEERRLETDGPVIELYRPLPDEGMETHYLFPVKK